MILLLNFVLFLLISVTLFTLPGTYFLQKNKSLKIYEKVILGTVIGFVIFTLFCYFLGLLNIPLAILPILIILDIFSFKNILTLNFKFILPSKKMLIIVALFALGIAGQMTIIAPSGEKLGNDLIFFSSNGHDGSWHIALMEEIKKGYPLQIPIFAGERLINYHFFSDIAPAFFSKYFKFSNLDLYFRFFPFLFSILLGSMAYLLGKKMGGSTLSGIWSAFFVYFVGSFGFIVTWLQNRTIGGESIFWATQIQSSIGNPPQIISNILVLTFLYLFMLYISKKNFSLFAICILLLGSLAVFKIYAAIVVLGALGIVGLIQAIYEKKVYIFSLFALSSLLAALLYIPNTANSTSFLIWEPWWFIRTMIVSRLNWLDLELRRQTFVAEGNWKRVFQIEITGFLIFFFGNLGMRLLGLISFFKFFRGSLNNYLYQLVLTIIIISFTIPLLFLQKGVAGNTIQFLQYFLLLFGVLAALTISRLQEKIKSNVLKISFISLIILFSIPTQLGLLYDFYHKPPLAKITSDELQALSFLKDNTVEDSIIITPPFNKYLDLKVPTPDIYAWSDTAYVAALSSRRTYLADTEQVDIMGYDLKKRLDVEKNIFLNIDSAEDMKKILDGIQINYIYFPKILSPKLDLKKTDYKKVFDNGKIEIWKVS